MTNYSYLHIGGVKAEIEVKAGVRRYRRYGD